MKISFTKKHADKIRSILQLNDESVLPLLKCYLITIKYEIVDNGLDFNIDYLAWKMALDYVRGEQLEYLD